MRPKLILTNDDGIDAPGMQALVDAVQEIGEAIVVAPAEEQSGVSHRITAHSPIGFVQRDERRFQVSGTPVDCAKIGLVHIAADADILISGINQGANLGVDVYSSGTVSAAREAAFLGYKSIAISQYVGKGQTVDWKITAHYAQQIIRKLLETDIEPGFFWNVNLPHPQTRKSPPLIRFCELDMTPHSFSYDAQENHLLYVSDFHNRPRQGSRDIDCCFGGSISVTRLGTINFPRTESTEPPTATN